MQARTMVASEKSIDVMVPASFAFGQWREFGASCGCDTLAPATLEITCRQPDRQISWRSRVGRELTGRVVFTALGRYSSRITLREACGPDVDDVTDPECGTIAQVVEQDLRAFKHYVEALNHTA